MQIKRNTKFIASILITVLLLSSMLLIPSQASAFTVLLSSPLNSYLLGETPSFTGSLNLDAPTEVVNIQQVQLQISGPLTFTVNLPVVAGSFGPLTLPKSGTTPDRGSVSGSISWTNIALQAGYGYGYANPAASPTKISYTINWQPPLLLDPLPLQSFALPSWQQAFLMPGNANVKGLGYDEANNKLYVLVDDNPNDKILVLDATSGNTLTTLNLNLGNNLEALDFFPGTDKDLYVADINYYSNAFYGKIHHLNTSGTVLHS